MKKGLFLISLFMGWLVFYSCKETDIKKKIDGGDYKFWFSIEETGTIVYSYFGDDGKYEVFVKNKSNGFHRYGSALYEDDLPSRKWTLKNDSIGWDSEYFHIVNLEKYRMVIKFQNQLDTLYSCYDGMIPVEFDHKW